MYFVTYEENSISECLSHEQFSCLYKLRITELYEDDMKNDLQQSQNCCNSLNTLILIFGVPLLSSESVGTDRSNRSSFNSNVTLKLKLFCLFLVLFLPVFALFLYSNPPKLFLHLGSIVFQIYRNLEVSYGKCRTIEQT